MMRSAVRLSVIISTHNRGEGLRRTLQSIVAQEAPGLRFEVLVVDNNSTDDTGSIIRSFAAAHPCVRPLFEPRQGVSYGRNAAIRVSAAPILAFTDDDIVVGRSWLANIERSFEAHPEIDYVSGRVLPTWDAPPPAWLASGNNGPCVLRDRGDQPLFSRAGYFFPGWATSNIAFRREVFDRVGLFSGDFPRGQDLEFIMRLWQANGRGMYAPDVVVHHTIPAERMTKAHHRMWHTREGDIRARVRFREVFDIDGRLLREPPRRRTILGTPAFLFKELAVEGIGWARATARRDAALAFVYETKVRQTLNYIRSRMRSGAHVRAHERLVESGTEDAQSFTS